MQDTKEEQNIPKHRDKIQALDNISLGISIVVAILMGVGVGLLLKNYTGYSWTLWIGVFWGISGAILNIYKAYSKIKKDLDKLAQEPQYQHGIKYGIKEEDDS